MALIIDDGRGNLTLTAGTLVEDINGNLFIKGLIVDSDIGGNLVIRTKGPLTDIIIYQDIQISDEQLRQDFINKFNAEKFQEAFSILENNTQFDSKKFVAEVLNTIGNYLNIAQVGTLDKIQPFLDTLQEKFLILISQYGNQGDYNYDTTYHMYNLVYYQDLVYLYINQISSSGIVPTNTSFWYEVGSCGEKGAGGFGLNLKYAWNASITYAQKDVVTHNGAMWIAIQTSINQEPASDSSYWYKFIEPQNAEIISSTTMPSERYLGQIWIEMLN